MIPESFRGVKPSDLYRFLGNTIGVNVIGCVFASIMPAYTKFEQKKILSNPYRCASLYPGLTKRPVPSCAPSALDDKLKPPSNDQTLDYLRSKRMKFARISKAAKARAPLEPPSHPPPGRFFCNGIPVCEAEFKRLAADSQERARARDYRRTDTLRRMTKHWDTLRHVATPMTHRHVATRCDDELGGWASEGFPSGCKRSRPSPSSADSDFGSDVSDGEASSSGA